MESSGRLTQEAEHLVAQMTLAEKASLLSGRDFWHLKGLPRLGLAAIRVSDGPHGLRVQQGAFDHLGVHDGAPATCFPTACALGSSFDRELAREIGAAIGREAQAANLAIVLGPGANIKRNPLGGRNFEYFSEDPFVTGELAAAYVQGMQGEGVGACPKHFVANNQERARMVNDSLVDERALHEIYLTGFETIVKKAQPWTLMSSYNKLNGTYVNESRDLLTDVLRTLWDFEGAVLSDWGAVSDRVAGVRAGQDIEMPYLGDDNDRRIVQAVQSDILDESELDVCARRVVELILKHRHHHTGKPYHEAEHHALARKAAVQSAVLLKNDQNLLPLKKNVPVAVIGQFAKQPRYQGAGSSRVTPRQVDTPLVALTEAGFDVSYADGYDLGSNQINLNLIEEAVALAKNSSQVVVFVGLPSEYESEGFDRTSLAMPKAHHALIEHVAEVNRQVTVVLMCGSPVELPWSHQVQAILLMYLSGQAVGSACADLLSGRASPSGKLAETWPLRLEDTPNHECFSQSTFFTPYRESIFVGYRWYESARREVAYPFGFGQSYTSFEVAEPRLSSTLKLSGNELTVTVTVTNTGPVAGAEVLQLYVRKRESAVYRASMELKGFEKAHLQPGESRSINFSLDDRSFAYYDIDRRDWTVEPGAYEILIGTSSREIHGVEKVFVFDEGQTEAEATDRNRSVTKSAATYGPLHGQAFFGFSDLDFQTIYGRPLPSDKDHHSRPYTIDSPIGDLRDSFLGRMILRIMMMRTKGNRKNSNEDMQKMMDAGQYEYPLRAIAMIGAMSPRQVHLLVDLLNGRLFRSSRNRNPS